MKSHYEILGVGEGADRRAIRAAYLKKIKASHPDRARRGKAASSRAAAINFAYFILRDHRRRLAYDLDLKRVRNGAAPVDRPVGLWEPRALSARPAPPPPPPRSRKAAATGILLGAAILGLLVVIADLEAIAPPQWQPVAAVADDAGPAPPEASPWVDRAMVDRAVDTLVLIRAHGGVGDAPTYSRNCYGELSASPSMLLLDHCLAFDVAAATWRRKATLEAEFAPQVMGLRHAAALQRVARGDRNRLREVNVATLSALARHVRPPSEPPALESAAYAGGEEGAVAAR